MVLKGVCEVVGAEVSQRYVERLFCVAATVAVRRPAPGPGSHDPPPAAHVTKLMAEQVPQVRPRTLVLSSMQRCECFRWRAVIRAGNWAELEGGAGRLVLKRFKDDAWWRAQGEGGGMGRVGEAEGAGRVSI